MGTQNLSRMFNPGSIAVIASCEKQGQVGHTLIRNLIEGGFKGAVYPVDPDHSKVMNLPAAKNVHDIQGIVDLAVVAAPIGEVPRIIGACADKGAAGAVVISGGGRETGDQGSRLEQEIKAVAEQSGIRIIGPNCIGIAHPALNLNASHMPGCPSRGRVAFLSQSGSVCASVMDLAEKENLGFSHFVSLGSMLDVDFADMIDYLGEERGVDSIIMYMENMTRIRHFMSAARAVSRIKPIICLKSGRSAAGARAASFHTGALAGEDAVYDMAFERAGIMRVDTFEQLFDFTRILAKQQRPTGRRLAIVTNAGGPGVMAVDALSSFGIDPAVLSVQTIEALETALEKPWSRTNPVDVLTDASCAQIGRAVSIAGQAPEVDGILMIHAPVDHFAPADLAQDLAELLPSLHCPVLTAWLGGSSMDKARQILNEKEVLTYDTPEKAVRAFVGLYRHSRNIDMLNEIPVRRDIKLKINHDQAGSIIESGLKSGQLLLSETDSKTVLEAYGIPVSRTESARTAVPDYELYLGAQLDAQFGPVIKFGMGGAMSDIIQDTALALPPLNSALAARAISSTKIAKVLKGYGQIKAVDQDLLETLLIRISRLVTDFPQICELTINPVAVTNGEVMGINAGICLASPPAAAPDHLIISPYPAWQEQLYTTQESEQVLIRPIKPEDAVPMQDFFESLSSQTVYLRFFTPLKQLSKRMLIQLTQIDYDREIALVATFPPQSGGKIIGSARIIFTANGTEGEFAIMLADSWQGKGIGAALLKSCLAFSKRYGLKRVFGVVLRENKQMLRLADKLGFKKVSTPASGEIELIIDIEKLDLYML
ncbi:GNAT family N-acetyltransferase [uncultured Desulfobacter sp.]|uniref:bifunctional acetate--CoA ligase family protein/GNAT family N-acetyltransferase n=1 Tax=uncultured Desulfobacter sp. TaxID=240139 RepID=UPI002AAC3B27|nr:GNAT family N-acetyltransferase [uncultured Desulfobacter sp.]